MTYKGSQVNKQTLDPTLQQEITNATNKANNSWQMNKYNVTSSSNLGSLTHAKAFEFPSTNWKSTTNVETLLIVFPNLKIFSGNISLIISSNYNFTNAGGGAKVEYNTQFYSGELFKYGKTITSISPEFAKNYRIGDLVLDNTTKHLLVPIFKAPTANNAVGVEVVLSGVNIPTDVMQQAYITSIDEGASNALGYPWSPQTATTLQVNTYNANNTITNIGVNRATRIFPQVNWNAQGIELWETYTYLPASIWGILELDIAGYSSAAGGAKIVVELGINVPNPSSPSSEFRNVMKVISASAGFTENFYVEVEHRPTVRGLYIKVYKRTYNDPIVVSTTFTSSGSSLEAFSFLNGFSNGTLYTNIAAVPAARQIDFDKRITENFTLFSSFKQKIASATTDKGVPTSADATSDQMAANIRAIPSGYKGSFNLPVMSAYTSTDVTIGPFNFIPKQYCSDLPGVQMCNGVQAQTPNESALKGDFIHPLINNGNGTYSLKITVRNQTGSASQARTANYFVAP